MAFRSVLYPFVLSEVEARDTNAAAYNTSFDFAQDERGVLRRE
jgi:hypothetical protein